MIPDNIRDDIRTALRWAWDQEILSQQDAEAALDWLDSQPVAPEPDWGSAPEWAQWWAVDGNDGIANWWFVEPYADSISGQWLHNFHGESDANAFAGHIEIPIGIDWRTLIRQRPESGA